MKKMYSRVLVPLDGSDRALAALGPARRLARLHHAQLGVVTVAAPETTDAEIEAVVAAGLRVAGDPAAPAIVLRGLDAASELARLDREYQDTLLCLTTRARRPLGRAVLGSVARDVVRASDQALVLVGPRCAPTDAGGFHRLLVCLDGTPEGEIILSWATRWSVASGLPLALMRVVYPLVDPASRIAPTEEQLDQLGYVYRVARRLERDGYQVAGATVQHPSTSAAIIDFAAANPDALIAVSTADPDPLAEALEGSIAAQVVRSSSAPVIVARHT